MRICQRRKSLELSLGLQNCLSDFKRGKVILLGGSKQNCERTQCGLETETMTSPRGLVRSSGSRLNTACAPLEPRAPVTFSGHDPLQEALCREGQISESILLGLP